jgi:hypothetical protein
MAELDGRKKGNNMSKIDTFAMWAPMEALGIKKGRNPNGGDSESMVGRIGGIVSAQTVDQQKETLSQEGCDWGYFLEKGWFNLEHGTGPGSVLGHPEKVMGTTFKGEPATRVEGVLYLAKAQAREVYETAKAMQKAGGARRLGFSVEGQVVERDSKDKTKIKKSRVLNVAITAHPVHPDARLEVLARSLQFGVGGSIGYQTATMSHPGHSLSPLLPQSIEAIPSLATYGAAAFRREEMTTEELAMLLTSTFPGLNYAQALSAAVEIARAVG